jgi:FKBP-type peptidyl-prolyl cis-trans isomerase (trigger factor)
LEERLGEGAIWNEIAGLAISDAYPKIVEGKNLRIVGRPEVTITKLAPGNPIGFTITVGLMPDVVLPEYRAIAADALLKADESLEVGEAELAEAIRTIRENHAHAKWHHDHPEDHSHNHQEWKEEDLPAFDEAFVRSLGGFKTVAEFTDALKNQIATGKIQRLKEKKRVAVADALIAATPFPVPPVFVESELNKMTAEFETTVGRMGMTVDEYLSKAEKDVATLRNEWRAEAKKRAQLQVILNAIAEKEAIALDEDKVAREIAHITEHFPDANPGNVRAYVETMFTNQKVFELLESGETSVAPAVDTLSA